MIGKGNIRVAFEAAMNEATSRTLLESTEGLDLEFITAAEKCTAFSIKTKSFESDEHKKEIRYLYTKRFFPSFDTSKFDNIKNINKDWKAYNNIVKELKQINSAGYDAIHSKEDALGPGEQAMYYIINNAVLAGGTSGGDLRVGNNTFEIKAIEVQNKKYAINFKTGGTFSVADTMQGIMKLKETYFEELGFSGKLSEVKVTEIRTLRESKVTKDAFAKIEKNYQSNSYSQYFNHYPFIWIINKGSNKGEIVSVSNPKQKDILIYAVTSGTVKPIVKIQ